MVLKELLFFFILNLFFFIKYNKLSIIFNIYDHPHEKRKIHNKSISSSGGIFFFINFLFIFFFEVLGLSIIDDITFINNLYSFLSFFLISSFFFLIGLFDDKLNLSYKSKVIVFFIILVLVVKDKDIIIQNIKFSNNFTINLGITDYIVTILLIFIFINAFNMYDGINLQSILYIISILIFLLTKGILIKFAIIMLLPSFVFLFYNIKNKCFLGNSGAYFISYLLSIVLIKTYNFKSSIFFEEILIIGTFPILDFVRVFFVRLVNKKNPLIADNNHIHHLLIKRISHVKSSIILTFLNFSPLFILNLFSEKSLAVLIGIFLYFILLYSLKKKR
jgi:UDP-GlcNAc:undecaprenyl-phosphate GlcNAc-1-phosphate transferase